jgi:hypothetical protein
MLRIVTDKIRLPVALGCHSLACDRATHTAAVVPVVHLAGDLAAGLPLGRGQAVRSLDVASVPLVHVLPSARTEPVPDLPIREADLFSLGSVDDPALRVEHHEPAPMGVYVHVPDSGIIHIHRVTDQ